MNYLTIELQTNNGTTANIVTQQNDLAAAESAYYSICASAVISSVEVHSIVLMDETGMTLKNGFFTHSSNS